MNHIEIYETDFEYSDWDETNYYPSELHVTLSSVALGGGENEDGTLKGFHVKVLYGLEDKGQSIFSFSGIKKYVFPKEYASMHLLSFLTEKTFREFDEYFADRKPTSGVYRQRFFPRKIDELYDDLLDALSVIRSQEATKSV